MLRHLGFVLNIAAIALFVPGILLPMFSLNMDMSASIGTSALSTSVIDKELSLLQTIDELWQDQRTLVAILIFLFSICIPITKTALVTIAYLKPKSKLEKMINHFVNVIGKWSMADVFVVAVFLAVLSTNQSETVYGQTFALFGLQINLIVASETVSALGHGYYYFLGYCLLAMFGTQLSVHGVNARNN